MGKSVGTPPDSGSAQLAAGVGKAKRASEAATSGNTYEAPVVKGAHISPALRSNAVNDLSR